MAQPVKAFTTDFDLKTGLSKKHLQLSDSYQV